MRLSLGALCVVLFTTANLDTALAQDPEVATEEAAGSEKEKVMAGMELNDEAAKAHFRLGQSLYDVGRFEESAKEFDLAFELSQRPPLLYNCYIAHRDAGNTKLAAARLEQYLGLIPKDIAGRTKLEATLESLKARVVEEERKNEVIRNEEASVAKVTSEKQQAEASALLAGQEADSLRDNKKRKTRRIIGAIMTGVGAAALAVGTVSGLIAVKDADNIAESCPDAHLNVCEKGFDLAGAIDNAQGKATLANIMFIGGGVLLAGGVALLISGIAGGSNNDEDPNEKVPEVNAACGPTGCKMDLAWSF